MKVDPRWVCERIIDKGNKKWITNDDQIVQEPWAESPRCNPADIYGPQDKCGSHWLVGVNWLLGFRGQGGIPINSLYHFHQQPTSLPILLMSCSNLCDGMPFEFLSGHVAGSPLLHGTVASSLVLGLTVWLPTPLILRLVKLILFHLMETDQLLP